MCYYWYLIERLFHKIFTRIKPLIHAMANLMKWVFSFDYYNYAQWTTVHLFDLMTLQSTCPHVFAQFLKGKFSFQKMNRRF